MDSPAVLRQLLRAPHTYRTLLTTTTRPQSHTSALLSALPQHHARYLSAPRILQPSFWQDIIPRPFRERSAASAPSPRKSWNPATPYIILAVLVGSQAIQVLWLKQERGQYMRRAEAKIGLLREVIEKVQNGEDVDVGKVLGTGVASEEGEWAQVLKEIEEEKRLFTPKKSRIAAKKAAEAERAVEEQQKEESVAGDEAENSATNDGQVKVEVVNGAKFF